MFSVRKRSVNVATATPKVAHRTPLGSFALCESEAAATNVFCSESEASAAKRPVGTEINHTFW